MQNKLKDLLSLIDLTSLNETDNTEIIAALCKKAVTPHGHVAAVCVYPQFVVQVKTALINYPVKIATVVNFPKGSDSSEHVIESIKQSIQHGATEMDVVFPYAQFLQGDKDSPYQLIRACKAACGETVLLKVILETGALSDTKTIAEVSYHVCHAGADFLKTSTGKIPAGATIDAARAMLEVIQKIPRPIGLKISGGVRTIAIADQYIALASEMMGADWVRPERFRIGASQLVDQILNEI
ncbi:MAG: deoxyribose-phosphate aldolase [Gammaproteobacteria bacterium]